jgi:hypothetical protein
VQHLPVTDAVIVVVFWTPENEVCIV